MLPLTYFEGPSYTLDIWLLIFYMPLPRCREKGTCSYASLSRRWHAFRADVSYYDFYCLRHEIWCFSIIYFAHGEVSLRTLAGFYLCYLNCWAIWWWWLCRETGFSMLSAPIDMMMGTLARDGFHSRHYIDAFIASHVAATLINFTCYQHGSSGWYWYWVIKFRPPSRRTERGFSSHLLS